MKNAFYFALEALFVLKMKNHSQNVLEKLFPDPYLKYQN